MFIIDIFINFRSSFINSIGDEISDPKHIAKNYIKGFWIDLISVLPFDTIVGKNSNLSLLKLFGLLKVVRVLRLGRIINYLNIREDSKMTLKLGNLIFFLILYIHCLACLWYYVVTFTQDPIWIPPLDYLFVETDLYI